MNRRELLTLFGAGAAAVEHTYSLHKLRTNDLRCDRQGCKERAAYECVTATPAHNRVSRMLRCHKDARSWARKHGIWRETAPPDDAPATMAAG